VRWRGGAAGTAALLPRSNKEWIMDMMETPKSVQGARSRATATMIDATILLTTQHREVDALFEKLEAATHDKAKVLRELVTTIMAHSRIEEKFFYPAARAIDEDLVLESFEEHEGVAHIIKRLHNIDLDDETFDAKITVLKEMIQHHVKEEEGELFPKVRTKLSEDTLQQLGDVMQKDYEHTYARNLHAAEARETNGRDDGRSVRH
jgi:hemerythrin superfamily protein